MSNNMNRRKFIETLGAGLLVTVTASTASAQRRSSGRSERATVAARLHISEDGVITVMTGKIETGQGSRTQLTQAAAEELRVSVDQIRLIMGDTTLCPDDGTTAGSRTTPSTVPAVRKGAATARELLVELVSERWEVKPDSVEVHAGAITHAASGRATTYGELAKSEDLAKVFSTAVSGNVELTPVSDWKVLGTSVPRITARDIVTGAHRYPSDIVRPQMLYGKVLRPPSYGATLQSVDLGVAEGMEGVIVVRDEEFIGCVAPTSFSAGKAVEALGQAATWNPAPHPSSDNLFSYLKEHVQSGEDRRSRARSRGSVEEALGKASTILREAYEIAYVQHAPMEPRAAVAEWDDEQLTVWTGTQAPNRVHGQLANELGVPSDRVRVIVPDMGGGFGGKHTGEVAVEAARLARAAGHPVSLRWTRAEEFMWAYFRPAALIEVEAGLDATGKMTAWSFTNINSGGAALETPYEMPNTKHQYVPCDSPLREGSYRVLAATANNFARESAMDELAAAAGANPLEFRLAHLKDERLRAVLEAAARRFGWADRKKETRPDIGIGLSCGTEKGSYVAACAEVEVDRDEGKIFVRCVCEVFECGAVQNPDNLRAQVAGCIIMGLGPALREEIRFDGGKILNGSFSRYPVPRMKDVPELDIHLLDRPDLPSAGGGETPIIAIAPAIANAVFDATGIRIRSMPIRQDSLS